MNTSKQFSHLPGRAYPKRTPILPTRDDVVAHLEHHVDDDRIDVRLRTSVRRIYWCHGTWSVETSSGAIDATHVVVATGYERVLDIPDWPCRQSFTGEPARRLPIGLHRDRHVSHAAADRGRDGGFRPAAVRRRPQRGSDCRNRTIEVVPTVDGFDRADVRLVDGRRLQPDVVICATGHRRGLEPLVGHLGVLDDRGVPLKGFAHLADRGLWFLGFQSRPGLLGAVAKCSRRIATAITDDVAGARRQEIPIPEPGRG